LLTAGTKLGPYEVVSPLGAGGMGEVYRARDARLSRDVAIKVLPPAFAADTERMRRFEQEARAVVNVALKDAMFASPAILDPKTGAWQRIHVKYDGDVWPLSWTADGKIFCVGWAMRATLWRFQY